MTSVAQSGMAFLRLPEVITRCGLQKSEIYRRVRSGRFPKPVRLGARATVWTESEIDAWILERIAERDRMEVAS